MSSLCNFILLLHWENTDRERFCSCLQSQLYSLSSLNTFRVQKLIISIQYKVNHRKCLHGAAQGNSFFGNKLINWVGHSLYWRSWRGDFFQYLSSETVCRIYESSVFWLIASPQSSDGSRSGTLHRQHLIKGTQSLYPDWIGVIITKYEFCLNKFT